MGIFSLSIAIYHHSVSMNAISQELKLIRNDTKPLYKSFNSSSESLNDLSEVLKKDPYNLKELPQLWKRQMDQINLLQSDLKSPDYKLWLETEKVVNSWESTNQSINKILSELNHLRNDINTLYAQSEQNSQKSSRGVVKGAVEGIIRVPETIYHSLKDQVPLNKDPAQKEKKSMPAQ